MYTRRKEYAQSEEVDVVASSSAFVSLTPSVIFLRKCHLPRGGRLGLAQFSKIGVMIVCRSRIAGGETPPLRDSDNFKIGALI